MPYAMEFRIAVANAYDECGSSAEVAEHGAGGRIQLPFPG